MKTEYFMIGMSNNEKSVKYMKKTIPIAEKAFGQNIELFEATTPETIDELGLNFTLKMPSTLTVKEGYREFSPTEKAVWGSHYRLWKHIQENRSAAWILEHDVDTSQLTVDGLIREEDHLVTIGMSGLLWCYYMDYIAADKVLNKLSQRAIHCNVDSFIEDLMENHESTKFISRVEKQKLGCWLKYGTTIDHP